MRSTKLLSLCLLLASCLDLAACHGNREQVILDFGQDVDLNDEVDDRIRQSIENGFAGLGIPAEQLQLSVAPSVTTVEGDTTTISTDRVIVAFEMPLSAAQREKVRALFEQIQSARAAWQPGVKISIPSEPSSKGARPTGVSSFKTTMKPDDSVSLMYEKPASNTQPTSAESYPSHCTAGFTLTPAYAAATVNLLDDNQVKLAFASKELDSLSQAGKFSASPDLREEMSDDQLHLSAKRITFDFGAIGEAIQVGSIAVASPQDEQDCVKRIVALGRPFTFFYGHGLDLVQHVEYHFGDAGKG